MVDIMTNVIGFMHTDDQPSVGRLLEFALAAATPGAEIRSVRADGSPPGVVIFTGVRDDREILEQLKELRR